MLNIGEIIQTIRSIIEARIGIIKNEIQDEFVGIFSRIIVLIMMGSLILIVFLFLSLSLAFYLNQKTQSSYLGFSIVALIHLFVVLIMFLTRDSHRVQNKINSSLKGFIFKKNKIRK
jgi:hypothetical protein